MDGCFFQVFGDLCCHLIHWMIQEMVVAISQNSKINWRSFSPVIKTHWFVEGSPNVFSYHVYMDFPWDSFWQKVFANTNCFRYIISRWASHNWHNYIQSGIYVGLVIPWFLDNKLCINNFTLKKGELLYNAFGFSLKFKD